MTRNLLLAGLVLLVLCPRTPAQAPPAAVTAPPFALRPATAPVPALRHRLLPERSTLVPGNAASFYHRASEMILHSRQTLRPGKDQPPGSVTEEQAAAEWLRGPIAAIPRERARRWIEQNRLILHEMELGARRQNCDWGFDLRQEEVGIFMSNIQEIRALGRLVALRIRLAILEGQNDVAADWLQTGFAMARHVAAGPALLQALVGAVLTATMTSSLEDLIQAPGTPSFYWALADRPHPFLDLAPAYEGERCLLEKELPQLREVDTAPWSIDKAHTFTDELQNKLMKLSPMASAAPPADGQMKDWSFRLVMTTLVARTYPEAKRELIARGRPAALIESMPAIQVSLLHTLQMYQQMRDDFTKWSAFPYYQAWKGMDEAQASTKRAAERNPLLALFSLTLPALRSAALAQVRAERHLDALQCIEAIRIHAAKQGGFPARLADLRDLPVPIDVATGEPFSYRVQGERAWLSGPAAAGGPDIPQYKVDYALKLTR